MAIMRLTISAFMCKVLACAVLHLSTPNRNVIASSLYMPVIFDRTPLLLNLALHAPLQPQMHQLCLSYGIQSSICEHIVRQSKVMFDLDREGILRRVTSHGYVRGINIFQSELQPANLTLVRVMWQQESTEEFSRTFCREYSIVRGYKQVIDSNTCLKTVVGKVSQFFAAIGALRTDVLDPESENVVTTKSIMEEGQQEQFVWRLSRESPVLLAGMAWFWLSGIVWFLFSVSILTIILVKRRNYAISLSSSGGGVIDRMDHHVAILKIQRAWMQFLEQRLLQKPSKDHIQRLSTVRHQLQKIHYLHGRFEKLTGEIHEIHKTKQNKKIAAAIILCLIQKVHTKRSFQSLNKARIEYKFSLLCVYMASYYAREYIIPGMGIIETRIRERKTRATKIQKAWRIYRLKVHGVQFKQPRQSIFDYAGKDIAFYVRHMHLLSAKAKMGDVSIAMPAPNQFISSSHTTQAA